MKLLLLRFALSAPTAAAAADDDDDDEEDDDEDDEDVSTSSSFPPPSSSFFPRYSYPYFASFFCPESPLMKVEKQHPQYLQHFHCASQTEMNQHS